MFEAPASPYLVPFDGSFTVAGASTVPLTDKPAHKGKHRKRRRDSLRRLQRVLAAGDRHAVLLVFQAMDAAGKDSTIRSVMQGVDPSGCQVFSFKKPSSLELDHDFLWRTTCRLPERGRRSRCIRLRNIATAPPPPPVFRSASTRPRSSWAASRSTPTAPPACNPTVPGVAAPRSWCLIERREAGSGTRQGTAPCATRRSALQGYKNQLRVLDTVEG